MKEGKQDFTETSIHVKFRSETKRHVDGKTFTSAVLLVSGVSNWAIAAPTAAILDSKSMSYFPRFMYFVVQG